MFHELPRIPMAEFAEQINRAPDFIKQTCDAIRDAASTETIVSAGVLTGGAIYFFVECYVFESPEEQAELLFWMPGLEANSVSDLMDRAFAVEADPEISESSIWESSRNSKSELECFVSGCTSALATRSS